MTTARTPLSSVERLNLLYRLSQAFNSSLDLDQVLNRVMDEVVAVLKAERGFVVLTSRDASLAFPVARGIQRDDIAGPQFQVSLNIIGQVLQDAQPVLTDDAQHDERFNMRQSVLNLGLRSILCVPLVMKDSVSGAIYVDNRLMAGIFTRDDLELLSAIASSAAVAIENARLYQMAVEKGRMEKELNLARDVQLSLLPDHVPALPGWQFAARWQPAREVAGDYYDFITFSDGRVGLLIADVSDKGMPAALFMGLSRAMVRASLMHGLSPAEAIAEANRLLCFEARSSMFVTLFYALIDPSSGVGQYVNAGHNPPRFFDHESAAWHSLTRTGPALGIIEEAAYEQRSLQFTPGDLLFCYTDGVTDAIDPDEHDFGVQRLNSVLQASQKQPAEDLLDEVLGALHTFTGSAVPFDDVTLVAVKKL